jgi:hypothetical protein
VPKVPMTVPFGLTHLHESPRDFGVLDPRPSLFRCAAQLTER